MAWEALSVTRNLSNISATCKTDQKGENVTWDSCSIGRIWASTVWTSVLVCEGRSSFCEASHDFELKTLSFHFLCAEVSLGSFAFEVGWLLGCHACVLKL